MRAVIVTGMEQIAASRRELLQNTHQARQDNIADWLAGRPISPLTSTAVEQFVHRYNQLLDAAEQQARALWWEVEELYRHSLRMGQETVTLAQSRGDDPDGTTNEGDEASEGPQTHRR